MSVPVVLLPEAHRDVTEARDYFEAAVLDRVAVLPELYGELQPGVRAAGVRKFGYVVYYRVTPGGVEVLAVLRGSRDPAVWQSRV